VLSAFRARLPAGLAMLGDDELIDTMMRSAFYGLYGEKPPVDVPLFDQPIPDLQHSGAVH
jgi:hypothetical protein